MILEKNQHNKIALSHIGESRRGVFLDENADIISYEEYYPFGSTSYRTGRNETEVSQKRYKYVMKELDNESGLYYYGARYYASWLARFISVDPLQHDYPYYTPFQYAGNKPITFIDLDGAEPDHFGTKDGVYDIAQDKSSHESYEWDWKNLQLNKVNKIYNDYYGWTWNNFQWNKGDKTVFSWGNSSQYYDPDKDMTNTKENIPISLIQNYYHFEGELTARLQFTAGYKIGSNLDFFKTDDADKLLNNFLYGTGENLHFDSNSDMAFMIARNKSFIEFADKFELEILDYYCNNNGTLNGFEGDKFIERNKPKYLGSTENFFSWTVMGGFYALEAEVTNISENQVNVVYTITDHFGAGKGDANSKLPGLAAMYYLQHNKSKNGQKYVPFIWDVTIERATIK